MSALNERIEAAVGLFGVTAENIMGPSRFRNHVLARQHVMRELRQGGWSLGAIGRAFNRHHTSVLHLTRGYEPPQIDIVVRALPVSADCRPRPKRVVAVLSADTGAERSAEIHHRRYMKEYRRNCIEGSAALRDLSLALLARRAGS